MKVKHTIVALKQLPPPPPDSNYVRSIKKAYKEAERPGSTCSYARLAARRSPQLGEQAKQTCPPLKVSSDIVVNHMGMVPDTNPADYLTDDIEFETMEVDEFRF